jgi:hypothetical protein
MTNSQRVLLNQVQRWWANNRCTPFAWLSGADKRAARCLQHGGLVVIRGGAVWPGDQRPELAR